jgi:rhodanese-related sulfurtransferase
MRYRTLATILAVGLLAAACSASGATVAPTFELISAGEASQMISDNAGASDFVILDVRTPEEYDAGHIAGSVNIDFYAADFRQQLDALDKNDRYFIYCRSGNRSGQTTGIMQDLGFATVWDLDGGINTWATAGLPLDQ